MGGFIMGRTVRTIGGRHYFHREHQQICRELVARCVPPRKQYYNQTRLSLLAYFFLREISRSLNGVSTSPRKSLSHPIFSPISCRDEFHH